MIRLNIHEAKTHLSKYLAKLEEGKRFCYAGATNPSQRSVRCLRSERNRARSGSMRAGSNSGLSSSSRCLMNCWLTSTAKSREDLAGHLYIHLAGHGTK